MARAFPLLTRDQLAAGRIARHELLLFDLPQPTGPVGFFSGTGELVWQGVTFHGAGTMFAVSSVGSNVEGGAVPLTIRLNGDARSGLTPTVLASIETVQYRGRTVTLWRRYLHPDTHAELSTELLYRGRIDTIRHVVAEGGESAIEASCESVLIDLARSGYRMRTDVDQRLIDPTDGSLRYVQASADQKIEWGKLPTRQKRRKLFGIF